MLAGLPDAAVPPRDQSAVNRYLAVRTQTIALVEALDPEDCMLQSAPFTSPAKWHLAHTTWFFDRFVLATSPHYRPCNPAFPALFNSYYVSLGEPFAQARRGMLSRPSLTEILAYRDHVDEHVCRLLEDDVAAELWQLIELGLNHEQQHQELILTDVKHAFHVNPLQPPVFHGAVAAEAAECIPLQWAQFVAGLREVGASDHHFAFDNERPRHRVICGNFELANRATTNAEYAEFMHDGGYERPELWLADGWRWVREEQAKHPLYWSREGTSEFTLGGPRDIEWHRPVCHVNYFEANAFAKWAGARLPTEFEWEIAAAAQEIGGTLLESGKFHPCAAREPGQHPAQMYGDVWEWTASGHAPYPGYRAPHGPLSEYNGKFMCSQMVCRGGSCVTPADHIRSTYRNFFYPEQRWQFLGIRLARDAAGSW